MLTIEIESASPLKEARIFPFEDANSTEADLAKANYIIVWDGKILTPLIDLHHRAVSPINQIEELANALLLAVKIAREQTGEVE